MIEFFIDIALQIWKIIDPKIGDEILWIIAIDIGD
jgi:hypothetical protein